jgi:hypothetical protein
MWVGIACCKIQILLSELTMLPKTLAHTPIHYYSSTMFVECLACILADTGQTLKFLAQLQNNVNDHNQSSTYLIIYLSFQRAPECRILHSKLQTFSRVLPSNPLGGGGGRRLPCTLSSHGRARPRLRIRYVAHNPHSFC